MTIGPNVKFTFGIGFGFTLLWMVSKGSIMANDTLREIQSNQREIRALVLNLSDNAWMKNDQLRWSYEFERSNRDKGLIVPMQSGQSGIVTKSQ